MKLHINNSPAPAPVTFSRSGAHKSELATIIINMPFGTWFEFEASSDKDIMYRKVMNAVSTYRKGEYSLYRSAPNKYVLRIKSQAELNAQAIN